MNHWEKRKLGDICSFVRGPFGGSLKKNNFKQSGYAVYEQQHAISDRFDDIRYFIDEKKFNEMKRFEVSPGDLIMSCSGTMGKISIVPSDIRKGIINQALLKLSPSKIVSNVFLKLWMQSQSFQDSLKMYSQGAAIQNVASVATLKNIEIHLPPLAEQNRIVAILGRAFTAIDKAKANTEKNLQNAKELFESYLQLVFENFQMNELVRPLAEYLDLITYGFTNPMPTTDEGPFMVTAKNVKNGIVDYKTSRRTSQEAFDNLITDKSRPQKGDVLLTKDGTLGRLAVVEQANLCINQSVALLRPSNQLNSHYLKYLLSSQTYQKIMVEQAGGATIKHIYITRVDKMMVSIPPISKQQNIVKKLDALSAETEKLEAVYRQKMESLENLKKSILQKAFAGELISATKNLVA